MVICVSLTDNLGSLLHLPKRPFKQGSEKTNIALIMKKKRGGNINIYLAGLVLNGIPACPPSQVHSLSLARSLSPCEPADRRIGYLIGSHVALSPSHKCGSKEDFLSCWQISISCFLAHLYSSNLFGASYTPLCRMHLLKLYTPALKKRT